MNVYVVIMAGGRGERLWPASTPTRPKPFLPLARGEPLIKATWRRALALTDPHRVYLVAEQGLAHKFRELLGIPDDRLIVEPVGKNTAPAVGLAALVLSQLDPRAIMVVLPADHLIPEQEKFTATVARGLEAAEAGYLVTLGIKPTHPATGYGYIQRGEPLSEVPGAFSVARFTEKPEPSQAEKFLAQGGYFWNAGIFLWPVDRILEEIHRFLPRLANALEELRPHWGTPSWGETLARVWDRVEKTSIDYGVLERAQGVAVVPAEFTWHDLGDWQAVWQALPRDDQEVATYGDHLGKDSNRTLIWGQPGKPVATLGVSELAIVDTPHALLVARLSRSQEVRELAQRAEELPPWEELLREDKGGMLEMVRSFPEQCQAGWELGSSADVPLDRLAGFSRVLCVGMGGSGITGDLLSSLLPCEVLPWRGYQLPPFIGEETLLVGISYSGKTEETLAAFKAGLARTHRALAISSGGELRELCRREGVPWIGIPAGLQPRAALGYLLFPLLALFRRLEVLPEDPAPALRLLSARAAELAVEGSQAHLLARTLCRHLPLIYGSHGHTAPVAFRWKTQINENAKQPAFWAQLPELCHNEIVGWELTPRLLPTAQVVFLRTPSDHPRVGARIEVLKEVLARRGLSYSEVWAQGETVLERLLSLLYLGDWVSVYLALLNRVDPTPVRPIQELKARLAELPWEGG